MTRRANVGLPWGAGAAAAGLLWAAGWMTFTLRDSATAGGLEPERMPSISSPSVTPSPSVTSPIPLTPAAKSMPVAAVRNAVAISRQAGKPRMNNPPAASGPIQQVGGYSQYKKSPLGCPSCIAREKALKERKALHDRGKLKHSPSHAGESEVGSTPEPMPVVESSTVAAPQAQRVSPPEALVSAPPVATRKPARQNTARQNTAPAVAARTGRNAPQPVAVPTEAAPVPDLEIVIPAPMSPGRPTTPEDEFDSSDAAVPQHPATVAAVAGRRPGIQTSPSQFFDDEAAADAAGVDNTFSDRQTETGERRLSPIELELQRRFEKEGREAPSLRFEDMPSMAEEGGVPKYMPPPALNQPPRRGFMDRIPFVGGGHQPNVSQGLAGQPPGYTSPPPQQPKPSFFKRLVPGFARRESSQPESMPVQRQMAAQPGVQPPKYQQPAGQQPGFQQPAAQPTVRQPATVAQPNRMPTVEEWRPGMPIPGQQPAKPIFRLPGFLARNKEQLAAPATVSSTHRVPELMTVPNDATIDAQPEAMPAPLNTVPPNDAPSTSDPPPQILAQPNALQPNALQPNTLQPNDPQEGAVAAIRNPPQPIPQSAANGYDSELNIGDDSILIGDSAKPRVHHGAQPQPMLDARSGGVFLDESAEETAASDRLDANLSNHNLSNANLSNDWGATPGAENRNLGSVTSDGTKTDGTTTDAVQSRVTQSTPGSSNEPGLGSRTTVSVAESAGAAAARGLSLELAAPTPKVVESPFTGLTLDVGEAESRIANPTITSLETERMRDGAAASANPLAAVTTTAVPELKIEEPQPAGMPLAESGTDVAFLDHPTEAAALADKPASESARTPSETAPDAEAVASTPGGSSAASTTPEKTAATTSTTATTTKPSDDRDPVVQRAKLAARQGLRGFKGFCPVVLRNERRLVDALPQFRAERRGRTYFFSTAAAVAEFELDAEKFIPVADGLDVIRFIADEPAAEGSLDHAVWYKGRLFLFSSAETRSAFIRSPQAYDVKLEEKLASKMVAPLIVPSTLSSKVADVPNGPVNAGVNSTPATPDAARLDAPPSTPGRVETPARVEGKGSPTPELTPPVIAPPVIAPPIIAPPVIAPPVIAPPVITPAAAKPSPASKTTGSGAPARETAAHEAVAFRSTT